jgi:hypothetical protein
MASPTTRFTAWAEDPASNPRDYFDVSSTDLTTGLPASNGLYATLPGWDYVTGRGTPKVTGLIATSTTSAADAAGPGAAVRDGHFAEQRPVLLLERGVDDARGLHQVPALITRTNGRYGMISSRPIPPTKELPMAPRSASCRSV